MKDSYGKENYDSPATRRFRLQCEYASRQRVAMLYNLVHKVFEEFDPERLYSMGCPRDEYDDEIRRIADNIDRERGIAGKMKIGIDGIAQIFALVQHTSFGSWTKPIEVHERDLKMAARFLELEAELAPKTEA